MQRKGEDVSPASLCPSGLLWLLQWPSPRCRGNGELWSGRSAPGLRSRESEHRETEPRPFPSQPPMPSHLLAKTGTQGSKTQPLPSGCSQPRDSVLETHTAPGTRMGLCTPQTEEDTPACESPGLPWWGQWRACASQARLHRSPEQVEELLLLAISCWSIIHLKHAFPLRKQKQPVSLQKENAVRSPTFPSSRRLRSPGDFQAVT